MVAFLRSLPALALALALAAPPAAFALPATCQSDHFRDNPLVGTLWSGDGRHIAAADLTAILRSADYVLAGEIHSNPDHHAIQARIIEAMVAAGERPAVVFE